MRSFPAWTFGGRGVVLFPITPESTDDAAGTALAFVAALFGLTRRQRWPIVRDCPPFLEKHARCVCLLGDDIKISAAIRLGIARLVAHR